MFNKSKTEPNIPFSAYEIIDHFTAICSKPLEIDGVKSHVRLGSTRENVKSHSTRENRFTLENIHRVKFHYAWKRTMNKQSTSSDRHWNV